MYPGLPHFKVPLRVTNGRYDVVDQDSDAEILQCCRTVLVTRPKFCLDAPAFGCADQTFRKGGADLVAIRAALLRGDSRIDALLKRDDQLLTDLVDDVTVSIVGVAEEA